MAKYFGQDDAAYPLLTAADIADAATVAIVLSGADGGSMSLLEAQKLFRNITYHEDEAPTTTWPLGRNVVQTGTHRGVHWNNGTTVYQLIVFAEDGVWPV